MALVQSGKEIMANRFAELAFILTLQALAAAIDGDLEVCVGTNVNNCTCNRDVGFKTYSVQVNGSSRCFTIYVPPNMLGPRPVVLLPDSSLKSIPTKMKSTMLYYGRRGIATIFVSNLDGSKWSIPDVITDTNPQVCEGTEFKYMQLVFSFVESLGGVFDAQKIYITGFSISSQFASFIGYCLSEKVQGIFQHSGPPVEKGFFVSDPFFRFFGGNPFQDPSAKYYPVYPCHEPTHPLINCFASGYSDPWVWSEDLTKSMHTHDSVWFEDEGQFASTIVCPNSGHSKCPMWEEFVIGCLGIYPPCTADCWNTITRTVKATCAPCAPSIEALKIAVPGTNVTGHFGAPPSGYVHQRPTTSKCVHKIVSLGVSHAPVVAPTSSLTSSPTSAPTAALLVLP